MSSGPMYQNPSLSHWDEGASFVHDERRLGFVDERRSGPAFDQYGAPVTPRRSSQYAGQREDFQVWNPSSRSSFDPYTDTPHAHSARELPIPPSQHISPPHLFRRSLIDDPAFAVDPHSNPNNWQHNFDTHTPSLSSFPPFINYTPEGPPRSMPVPVIPSIPSTRSRPHSFMSDMSMPSSPAHPIYYVPPSVASSSSGHSTSSSEARASDRSPRTARGRPDSSSFYVPPSVPPTEISSFYVPPSVPPTDVSSYREGPKEKRSRRVSQHQAPAPPPSYDESVDGDSHKSDSTSRIDIQPLVQEKRVPVVLSYDPQSIPASEATLPGPSDRPQERQRKKSSSRPPPPDLDSIDEMDETVPYGIGIHHKGPYEAIAAILGQSRPLELSPDGAPIELRPVASEYEGTAPTSRPHRRHKPHSHSQPNPMSLNLKPGQILQGSIYQPPPPPHRPPFPLERAAATYPPDHYLRPPHANMYPVPGGEGDPTAGGSPLRRNQTLPAPAQGRYTPGPAYHIPPPTPQVQPMSERRPHEPPVSQRGSHRGYTDEPRGRQLLPDQEPPHSHHRGHRDPPALARNGTEPYPNRGRRDSRLEPAPQPTSSQSQLPPQIQPQTSHREERRPSPFRPEQLYEIHTPPERDTPPDSRPDSFFAGPPPPSSRPPQQTSRHSPPSSRPPPAASRPPPSQHTPTPPRSTAQAPPQDQQARRYEPPSQTLASMQNQPPSPDIHLPPPSIMSSSTQSGLAPSHVPRRLVMPTPLAPSPERNAPSDPRARPQPDNRIRFTDNARGNGAQHQHHPKASTIPMQQAGARNMLRKRSATVAPPLHAPVSAPAPVQSGGLLAFFGLGKGSKPQVREMRIPEPRAVNGVREKETRETREKETARRLSKRR